MEVQFTKEIAQLRQGVGEVFHGEGILAITKGLLQAGVAYVGGYQGAPVSHLLDVMVQARPYLDELGVHVQACSNEASAAAMLGASIHYPLRTDPVATVIDGCVGCGLCGENAHAAVLCPSFYRAEVIQNPNWWDRLWNGSSLRK